MKSIIFISLVLILFACTEDTQTSAAIVPPLTSEVSILVFKKEKRIELRSDDNPGTLVQQLPWSDDLKQIASGHYTMNLENQNLFNSISQLHTHKLSQVLVLPNDPGPSGQLSPCFACPHSETEQYAKLEMLFQRYLLNK